MNKMKRDSWLRKVAVIGILIATAGVFSYYFAHHPEVRHQLSHTSLSTLLGLLGLYMLAMAALTLVTIMTLRLCRLKIKAAESLLITAYTAVVNFFGPLQSGPAVRAVYLKKKYDLNLKIYAAASLGYLFFWGFYSGLFLMSGLLKWWLLPVAAVVLAVAYWMVQRTRKTKLKGLDLHGWYYLALATFLHVSCVTLIYFVELITVAPGTSFHQAIIYTGAANLALFVSLTPGAIGFRESFLVFSQHLHHISDTTIVAANILDRAVYIVLLLILAAFIFGTHAQRRLKARS